MRRTILVLACLACSIRSDAKAAEPLQAGSIWRGGALKAFGGHSDKLTLCVTSREGRQFRGLLTRDNTPGLLARTVTGTAVGDKAEFVEHQFSQSGEERPYRKYVGLLTGKEFQGRLGEADRELMWGDFSIMADGTITPTECETRVAAHSAALKRARIEHARMQKRISDPALAAYKFELLGPSKDGEFTVDFRGLSRYRSRQLTREDLAAIKPLQRFGNLNLFEARLSDEDMKVLADFEFIERVDLLSVPINGTGLKHLRNVKGLKSLNLPECKLTDEGLRELGQLAGLQSLTLSKSGQYTGEGLRSLSGLKDLKVLNVFEYQGKLSPDALTKLGPLPALEELAFHVQELNEASLAALKHFSSLKVLSLAKISAASLEGLAQVRSLQGLTCTIPQGLNDKSLLPLATLPKLSWLGLGAKFWVPGQDFAEYVRRLPKMSKDESKCYTLVRVLEAISERDADRKNLRDRALLHMANWETEEDLREVYQFVQKFDKDTIDLQKKVGTVARTALLFAERAFKGDEKRALPVWVTVFVYSGIEAPRLQANLTPKQWEDVQKSQRSFRMQSGN